MTKTIRMTVAQAIVKFLDNQYVSMDGEETKFVEGFFTILTRNCSRTWRSAGYRSWTVKSPSGKKRTGNVSCSNRICKAEQS